MATKKVVSKKKKVVDVDEVIELKSKLIDKDQYIEQLADMLGRANKKLRDLTDTKFLDVHGNVIPVWELDDTKEAKNSTIEKLKRTQQTLGSNYEIKYVFSPNLYDEALVREIQQDEELLTNDFLSVPAQDDPDFDAELEFKLSLDDATDPWKATPEGEGVDNGATLDNMFKEPWYKKLWNFVRRVK